MKLNERIKECRQRCGLTQEQVAETLNISRQAVTKWENGQSAPSTENLFRLAQLFGTTVDLLLTDQRQQPQAEKSARIRWNLAGICVAFAFLLMVLVTPFEVNMYTPELFQYVCVILHLWSVAAFGFLLYLLLCKKQIGQDIGLYITLLILPAIGEGIFAVFFWQCWICLAFTVLFLIWLIVKNKEEKRKNVENNT